MTNTLGGTGGAETHTLATTNLPSHDHSLNSHTHGDGSYAVDSHRHSISGSGTHVHGVTAHLITGSSNGAFASDFTAATSWSSENETDGGGDHDHGGNTGYDAPGVSGTSGAASGNTGTTGSGTAVNHLPPYMLVHKILKY